MSIVYSINKGINRSIEFKGIKAQYILYLAVGLVGLLVLFAIGYIAGAPIWLCALIVGGLGFFLFSTVSKYSRKYGEHGLLKKTGYRSVPEHIRCHSRSVFFNLTSPKK
ncbi:DUF4133 domain-containing protein [Chitinophaga arvensicola]|uniref:DUF4133 domain-containing protein n=1 Tax=Chitinophaga arvensicola TaxID=29529 RepID=A0A1I0PNT1_9BACT|nr:DUF4133 domain-containing protein [Chitinophaga arvensicola]SEW16029.1 protein of unknown function [Chitinophaga arvensicola]